MSFGIKRKQIEQRIIINNIRDMKLIHGRLDNAIEKISEVSNSINRMLAVHEEKLSSQEEAILGANELLEKRRSEFNNEIKDLHSRITVNNKELTSLMSKQHNEQSQSISRLQQDLTGRVAVLDKFRWLLIGGSIVLGFIIHKMMNIGITFS